MASISTWVISITGICVLSVLVDLIMPEGKTAGTIKNVFSYVIVLVAIAPLPKIINGDFSLDGIFSNVEIDIQDEYIYNINQAKLDKWTITIENGLVDAGVYGSVVSISANIFESDMKIDAVYVDLYNAVISENLANKDIKTEVVDVVLNCLDIEKNKVIIYE